MWVDMPYVRILINTFGQKGLLYLVSSSLHGAAVVCMYVCMIT